MLSVPGHVLGMDEPEAAATEEAEGLAVVRQLSHGVRVGRRSDEYPWSSPPSQCLPGDHLWKHSERVASHVSPAVPSVPASIGWSGPHRVRLAKVRVAGSNHDRLRVRLVI